MPQPFAASTDQRSAPAAIIKSSYDQSPIPNDGAFRPMYPAEYHDMSGMNHGAAVATGQPPTGFSAARQTHDGYTPPGYGWDFGGFGSEMTFPADSPGTFRTGGPGLQPLAAWDCGAQAYPAQMGNTMAIAGPMPQYVPVQESMGDYFGTLKWPPPPPPPIGQISSSPSQSSYFTPSPASGVVPQFSRHNSSSSLPTPKAAPLEQVRSDTRFQPVPDQALNRGEDRSTPAAIMAASGSRPSPESSSFAGQNTGQRKDGRNNTSRTTATTDYSAGIISPAMTPSPGDRTTAFPSQLPRPKLARVESHRQKTPKTSRNSKALAPARRTATQKKRDAQVAQQQQQNRPARSRVAANKCRAKTKQAMADLESTERAMSSAHQELSVTARDLRNEVLQLKTALLAHGNCDDSLIQQYLINQARRVGYGTAQRLQLQHQQQHQQRQGCGHGHAQQ